MSEIIFRPDSTTAFTIFNSLDVRESTIKDYTSRIPHFLRFAQEHGFDRDVLLNYKRHLNSLADYSVSTKNKYLVCAKIFLRECYRRGLLPIDLSIGIKTFQQNKKHKMSGLDETDVSLICQWLNEHPEKLRERALLCLLLFQGLRQAEICSLKIADISWRDSSLLVLGKGRDDKECIHLHPKTKKALRAYSASLPKDSEYFFTSLSRKSNNTQLTVRGLRYIIKDIFEELGIDRNVHGFRHYFTTKLIQQMPGSLLQVAQFTRHKNLEMLTVYYDGLTEEEDVKHFKKAFSDVAASLS